MDTAIFIFWLAVIIIAAILEGITSQLVSIWVVAGGVAALVAKLCGAGLPLQCVIFVAVTGGALLATRPVVKKMMGFKKVDTNAGRYIGQVGIVTQQIDNVAGQGQVKVLGNTWTARTRDGTVLSEGTYIFVETIEGVKLIVRPREPEQGTPA